MSQRKNLVTCRHNPTQSAQTLSQSHMKKEPTRMAPSFHNSSKYEVNLQVLALHIKKVVSYLRIKHTGELLLPSVQRF
jgi:hypothetical protein